jgi:alcohol dehydrogenase
MKALVYHGPGEIALEDGPMPIIKTPTDAIVKITKTTICGTDLHIIKGDVQTVAEGRILGHEGAGIIDQAGETSVWGTTFLFHAFRHMVSAATARRE